MDDVTQCFVNLTTAALTAATAVARTDPTDSRCFKPQVPSLTLGRRRSKGGDVEWQTERKELPTGNTSGPRRWCRGGRLDHDASGDKAVVMPISLVDIEPATAQTEHEVLAFRPIFRLVEHTKIDFFR